jgi:hypothetical protein
MMQRVFALTGYFLHSLFFSLAGLMYTIGALVFWRVFFDPSQGTPHGDYYVLTIGVFGAGLSFLTALTISARANQAVNYPVLVRLPSRVEYLTAVLFSTFLFSTLLQIGIALLSLVQGPALTAVYTLEIPPLWIAINLFTAVLALNASDFVTNGWSRVYVFGLIAIFLFGQSVGDTTASGGWAQRLTTWAFSLSSRGWVSGGALLTRMADWLNNGGNERLNNFFGIPFWPFHAIADATVTGLFTPIQALAPAILLLYATILFMLAASFFATKDLHFTE